VLSASLKSGSGSAVVPLIYRIEHGARFFRDAVERKLYTLSASLKATKAQLWLMLLIKEPSHLAKNDQASRPAYKPKQENSFDHPDIRHW
jgi:hypothetical protein